MTTFGFGGCHLFYVISDKTKTAASITELPQFVFNDSPKCRVISYLQPAFAGGYVPEIYGFLR